MRHSLKCIGLALAGLFMLVSCQREVSEVYMFSYEDGVEVTGGSELGLTRVFLNSIRWSEVKEYGNEAYSEKGGREANEEEAMVDFDYKMAVFDQRLPLLYEEYRLAEVDSAVGTVTLRLSCKSGEERVVREESRQVRYVSMADTAGMR